MRKFLNTETENTETENTSLWQHGLPNTLVFDMYALVHGAMSAIPGVGAAMEFFLD